MIKAMLDKRGHADAYGLDDTLSRHRMLTIAKEKLALQICGPSMLRSRLPRKRQTA